MTLPEQTPNLTLSWTTGDAFAHTLFQLLQSIADASEEAAIEVLQQNLFVLHSAGQSYVVLRYLPELEEKLAAIVSELVTAPGAEALELALIGGDERASELLQQARPRRGSLRVLHMSRAADGTLAEPVSLLGRGRSRLQVALEQARQKAGTPVDHDRARASIAAAEAAFARQARERRAFSQHLSRTKPVATYAILCLIGLTFLLELATGATQSTQALVQMGALYAPAVFAGEWWRIASCTLLHAGVMHVAFNAYVLYALGGMVERLLGTARFVLLYVISALAASLGSLLLIGGISVGASGAIWGLLGAEAALAFGPSTLLPSAVRKSVQRATVFNLAINTAASFLPFVDWAAHFAGGAAGAALVFSGLLLPRRHEQKVAGRSALGVTALVLFTLFFGTAIWAVLQA